MSDFDPEMMEYLQVMFGPDIVGSSSPDELKQMYGRKLYQTIALNDLNRNAASLQTPGYTAPEGVNSSLIQRDDGKISFSPESKSERDMVYALEDASPFKTAGFVGKADQGYGEQTLGAWGDALMRDYSPMSDSHKDPYNMQLEEPDDDEVARRKKAALAAMGGQ